MSYITKRGYVIIKKNFENEELKKIRDKLTVTPKVIPGFGTEPEPFKIYLENKNKMYLPTHYGINKFGKTKLKMKKEEKIRVKFNGKLREHQKVPIKKCIETFKTKGGGILSLPCGFGKTCCGCYLAAKMCVKTLVIVNKTFLVNQWIERIKYFLPEAKIGKIQQKTIDIEGKDIVIGMLQSIAMRKYELDVFDSFGLVILDECHTVPSKVFSKTLQKVNSKYMLGLSATPNRKDGLTKVLKWFIGDIIYKYEKLDTRFNVTVERYSYNNNDNKYSKEVLLFTKKPNIARMVTNIVECKKRNKFITEKIIENYKKGRKILILSARRKHLEEIYKLLIKNNIENDKTGYYVGGMKKEELKLTEDKNIILGTYSMASTGMDIAGLNTLLMISPMSSIEQSVGRILRKKDENFNPLVIDICDQFSVFYNQSKKRLRFYNKKKYNIDNYSVDSVGNIIEEQVNEIEEDDRFEKVGFCFDD